MDAQLQRFLMPKAGEPYDVRMLYLIESSHNDSRCTWDDRSSINVPARNEVSFLTYFNAFPASYWRRWSQLDTVILKVEVEGTARVEVFRSKIDASRLSVTGEVVTDDEIVFELPLNNFEDGGWLWFEVSAETDCVIKNANWYAPHAPKPQVMPDGTEVGPFERRATVGIPTFNRPKDAVAALEALASDPEVDAIIDAVLMPDQGNKHPADEPGYKAVTEHFGERFFEFRQGNLGGSGGYSRIMYEALGENTPDSPFIIYMDDDILIEPESILRAVQAARYAKTPTLIGGQMLNLQRRSHLHSMGEVVDRDVFMWTAAPHTHYDHDFAVHPLNSEWPQEPDRDIRNLHRRIDVEYNGWWMCTIPRVVAQTIGQPLPLFIKWDDGEYGLRAGKAGFPTASWPGIAIWHMAWTDKDDAIDWQAYFHLRNRLIVAALQHDGGTKGLLRSMQKATAKHLVCMEYSTVAIQNEAMKDFLAGPDHLFEILETSLPRINALRKEFTDAQVVASASELPQPSGAPGVPTSWTIHGPLAGPKKLVWLAKSLKHTLTKEDRRHHEVPQANLAPINARWFSLGQMDSATVTTADGSGVVFRKRDRGLAKELLKESMALQKQVVEEFDRLRGEYRAAYDRLTSREAWGEVFDA